MEALERPDFNVTQEFRTEVSYFGGPWEAVNERGSIDLPTRSGQNVKLRTVTRQVTVTPWAPIGDPTLFVIPGLAP